MASNSNESMIGFPGGFTVLMAVYEKDDVELFERAMDSVYANSLQPNALVLVIDGPVPAALGNIIDRLQDKYGFEAVKLTENVGLALGLNEGLKHIKTDWVVRADADDYNHPDRFARQAVAIAKCNGSVDIIGSAIQEVERDGSPIAIRCTVEEHNDIIKYAMTRNPFNHMTVAYRTEFALRCGGYPLIHLKEDYGLWVSMLASGAIGMNVPDILVDATTGRDMYRRRGGMKYAIAEIALQKHLTKNGLTSPFKAIIHGLSRSSIFLLPSYLRGLIYKVVLRSS